MIGINNLTTNLIDEEFLKKIAQKVLEGEKKNNSDLSIALIGQGRMRELNKKYRGKNKVTDVLSFPDKEMGLGEIVICLREVKKNAKKFKSTFEKELIVCLIHGILHLFGYDHEVSEEKAKTMEEKQNYYLKYFLKNEKS
ncbi:rRNA maturation RNase YbeY [Patescibacteria group bacterium]